MTADSSIEPPANQAAVALSAQIRQSIGHTDEGASGTLLGHPHLNDALGSIRLGALAIAADSVGGMAAGKTVLPKWVVTLDLSLRTVTTPGSGPFHYTSRVLRAGQSTVVAEVDIHRESAGHPTPGDPASEETTVARAIVVSSVLVPGFELSPMHRGDRGRREFSADDPPVEPLPEFLGLRTLGDEVELDLVPRLRNPWGFMHGGITALLADYSAERVAQGLVSGRPVRINDLMLRYLLPAKVGPIRATPRVLGQRGDGSVLVEVAIIDAGSDDRLCAVATLVARPA